MLWHKLSHKNLTLFAKEIGISEVAIKNPANKLFKELDTHLEVSVQDLNQDLLVLKRPRLLKKKLKRECDILEISFPSNENALDYTPKPVRGSGAKTCCHIGNVPRPNEMTFNPRLKDILKEQPLPIALGAGFFGFFAHLGFVEALKKEGIEISMISGSSAGALVGAILGSNISTPDALKLLSEISVKDVWDPGLGLGYLKWKNVENILRANLHPRLEELSLNVAISTFEVRTLKTKVFTEGETAPIVRASCTPPFLVHPAKINGKRYFDGGIFDKSGIMGIPKEKRFVSHFLMSHLRDRKWDFSYNLKKRRANQLIICFSDLIEVKPSNLRIGYEAYARCFENTMRLLNTDISDLNRHQSFYGELKEFK